MIDLTLNDEDSKKYITDIEELEDKIQITYGDGRQETDTTNTPHNMNVYRLRMIDQVKNFGPNYEIVLGKEIIKNQIKKILSLIIDVAAIYMNVSMNPNTILKIIFTVLLVGGELFYLLWNTITDIMMNVEVDEILSLEYYVDNFKDFEHYNQVIQEYSHVIPIEFISRFKLSKEDLEKIRNGIIEFKKAEKSSDQMILTIIKKV